MRKALQRDKQGGWWSGAAGFTDPKCVRARPDDRTGTRNTLVSGNWAALKGRWPRTGCPMRRELSYYFFFFAAFAGFLAAGFAAFFAFLAMAMDESP